MRKQGCFSLAAGRQAGRKITPSLVGLFFAEINSEAGCAEVDYAKAAQAVLDGGGVRPEFRRE